ncbi:MAG TPA: DUF4145 domain-containing protein [Puia sp.]|nr:DUF4145 domain-containing protein [Puia sp.]
MNQTKKMTINKSLDKEMDVFCLTCQHKTRHKVLSSVDETGSAETEDEDSISWEDIYQIIICQGCRNISFRNQYTDSEMIGFDDEDNFTENIYPKRSETTWKEKDYFNLPKILRRIYRETIDSYNNDNLTLCAAGLRALVEGFCSDIEITYGRSGAKSSDNLKTRIDNLHTLGKITEDNARILHEHRFLGNEAIHELSLPSIEELNLAIELIEHIFDNIYEIPKKARELREKRLRS